MTRSKQKKASIAVFAVVLGMTFSQSAKAFNYLTYNGTPVRWYGNGAILYQNLYSIPLGSEREQAYHNAVDRWQTVVGMRDILFRDGYRSETWYDMDDEYNDVAIVSATNSDLWNASQGKYSLGATLVEWDGNVIYKTDTIVSSSLNWSKPSDAQPASDSTTGNGWAVFLHELGHAHGLSLNNMHTTGYSVMRGGWNIPTQGADKNSATSPMKPLGDDAHGGRFLYPSGYTEWNVSATSSYLASDGDITDNFVDKQICPGGSWSVTRTTVNRGQEPVTISHRVYLVPDAEYFSRYSATGITVSQWYNSTHAAQTFYTVSQTATVPCGTAPGMYWLMHKADRDNVLDETSETDNITTHGPVLVKAGCGC